MKIAFLGGLLSPKVKRYLESTNSSTIQYAADSFQKSILKGFAQNNIDLEIVSIPFVTPWMFNSMLKKISSEKYVFNSSKVNSYGFINIFPINLFSRFLSAYKGLKKRKHDAVIIYSVHSPFLLAGSLYKHIQNKNTKLCLVVPDLPEYMSESNNLVYKFLKKIDKYLIDKLLKSVDCFVLLSPLMVDRLPVLSKQYIVLEGIALNEETPSIKVEEKETDFVFLYTGTLDRRYNILDLVDAFRQVESEKCQLWICGKGNAENEIQEASKLDNRIRYFGQIPNDQALILQQQATVLINPRKPSSEFTKYSFPSKTIEYMVSGTPTMMYKLPSIPKDYYPYIIFIEENVKSLQNNLSEVMKIDSRLLTSIGAQAKNFIIKNKTSKKQVSRIVKLIKNVTIQK